eukprot:3473216-Amphidinium_carterae.1
MTCIDGVTRRVSGDCSADCSAFETESGGITIPYPDMLAFSEIEAQGSTLFSTTEIPLTDTFEQ